MRVANSVASTVLTLNHTNMALISLFFKKIDFKERLQRFLRTVFPTGQINFGRAIEISVRIEMHLDTNCPSFRKWTKKFLQITSDH